MQSSVNFLLIIDIVVSKALADAGLKYSDVEQAVVGYCYGERLVDYIDVQC